MLKKWRVGRRVSVKPLLKKKVEGCACIWVGAAIIITDLIELCKSWVHLSGRHRRPPATDDDFVVNQKLGGAKVGCHKEYARSTAA